MGTNYYTKYLVHHGIKGMKWGVRHDPQRVGGVSKRNRKKYLKAVRREGYNRAIHHDDQFDRSDAGRKLLNRYQQEIRKMENSNDDNYNFKPFYKAEETYLRAQCRYTGSKLLKEFGEQKFRDFLEADGTRVPNGKPLVKVYEDSTWERHTY